MTAGAVQRLRDSYEDRPLGAAAAMFAALASVRIAGAFDQRVMVASLALTPLVLLAVPRAGWARIGLRRVASRRRCISGVALVVAAYAAAATISTAALGRGADNWVTGIPLLFERLAPAHPLATSVVAVVCMGVLVPVAEEVCYRGVLHDALRRHAGTVVAVTTTAGGWAVVHLGDYGLRPFNANVAVSVLASVFLMGLALGACRVRTGSVLGCIVAQGVANLLLVAFAIRL